MYLLSTLALAGTATAAAILQQRDLHPNPPSGTCHNPGDYKCAALVIYDGFDFPGVGWHGESSSRLATVVNGNCDSIHTDGTLDPRGGGNGFYGNLQTSYGTSVEVEASYVRYIVLTLKVRLGSMRVSSKEQEEVRPIGMPHHPPLSYFTVLTSHQWHLQRSYRPQLPGPQARCSLHYDHRYRQILRRDILHKFWLLQASIPRRSQP